MPYTLTMGLVWFAAAFVIGLLTGVLLRSVVARRQVAAARDGAELRRLQRRIDELEAARDHAVPPAGAAGSAVDTGSRPATVPATDRPGTTEAEHAERDAAADRNDEPSAVGDDLTRIEGLGPAVSELCEGVGITTYAALAATDVAVLRTMLDDAGARYQVHDPTTWPTQARLLAEGREHDFERLVETIRRGDPAEDDPPGPVAT